MQKINENVSILSKILPLLQTTNVNVCTELNITESLIVKLRLHSVEYDD